MSKTLDCPLVFSRNIKPRQIAVVFTNFQILFNYRVNINFTNFISAAGFVTLYPPASINNSEKVLYKTGGISQITEAVIGKLLFCGKM